MEISLIIPIYNENKNIIPMYDEIVNNFDTIEKEIIFINDGSTDNSLDILRKLKRVKTTKIIVIDFSRNFGKEAAILAGLNHSTGKYTCIIDGDLQQPPKTALDMYLKLKDDSSIDSVVAYQKVRKQTFFVRTLSTLFYKIINRISNVDFYESASDFRVFNRKVKNAVLSVNEKSRFSKGIFAYIGFTSYYYPYIPDERRNGETKWSLISLIKYSMTGFVSYSKKPLMIPIINMILIILLFFLILIIPNLNVTLISAALILFSINGGIFTLYISKLYDEIIDRPIYIISDVVEI